MVRIFLALAAGQLLISWADIETAAPFNAIIALFALALVDRSDNARPPLYRDQSGSMAERAEIRAHAARSELRQVVGFSAADEIEQKEQEYATLRTRLVP